mgnify:CR=1 FL=1
MNKRKDIKKAMCQNNEKRNIKGSDKVLRSNRNNFNTFDDSNTTKGVDEQVTLQQVLRLIEVLKEKGYTLNEAVELFKRIANKK